MNSINRFASSPRRIALTAGILYLLTFVSIPTLSLYNSVRNPNFIIGPGPDTEVIIGAILEIVVALAGIGSAIALYSVLKKQNEEIALALVGARILEASTIFFGVASLLTIVALRQGGVGADALPVGQALVVLYDRIFSIGQSLIPVADDLLLGYLLYKSRLVPQTLSLIGIIGAFFLLSSDISHQFGLIEQRSTIAFLAAVPVAFFEFSLGLWLVIKGFNPAANIIKSLNTNN